MIMFKEGWFAGSAGKPVAGKATAVTGIADLLVAPAQAGVHHAPG